MEGKVSFPNLAKWMRGAMREHQHHGMPMKDLDIAALSYPPKTTALRYQQMKAYGDHFQVSDCNMEGMVSFHCGVKTH